MFKTIYKSLIALTVALSLSGMTHAADVKMRVLGWYGNQPQSQELERPFWKSLESETNGMFSVQFRTIDELGLKGFESLRTLKSGSFDIVSFQITFVGGEAPVLMGVDLPGSAFNFEELKKNIEVYRPIMEKELGSKFNAKLIAAWTFPFQILYCKGESERLEGMRGKKIRVSGGLSAKLIEELGGAGVTLAGPEVYQGLMQGVVDCAITGSQYGNSNNWFEVSNTLNTTPVGGAGVVLTVARKEFWDKLTSEQQQMLEKKMIGLEENLWKMAAESHVNGINCNTGTEPCKGNIGKMKLDKTSDADRQKVIGILKEQVVPLWLKDCNLASPTCGDDWFKTVGSNIGITK